MLAFGMPGPMEMFLILVVVLVLFGAKKIPELARSLGKATKEFKEAKSAFNDAVHEPHDPQIESQHQNVAPPADDDFEVDDKKEAPKEEAKADAPKEEAKAEAKSEEK
jgi:sec-independent protein translocase protein TatA